MSLKFYEIIEPLQEKYESTSDTWGSKIVRMACRGVYLKPQSVIEQITYISSDYSTIQGKSNIIIVDGDYYFTQLRKFYTYTYDKDDKLITLQLKSDLDDLKPYERRAGRYIYNMSYLQSYIYSHSQIGYNKVGQNYWRIKLQDKEESGVKLNTYCGENDEYFYYTRTYEDFKMIDSQSAAIGKQNLSYFAGKYDEAYAAWVAEPTEEKKKIMDIYKEQINDFISEDTTLMNAYAALKKAMAMAEFYCTCLPILSTDATRTSDDFNFISFYRYSHHAATDEEVEQKLAEAGDVILEDKLVEIATYDLRAPYYIDPQTHVIRLGLSDSYYREDTGKLQDLKITYWDIRKIHQEGGFVVIRRPSKSQNADGDWVDYPTDTHFEQIIQKVNSSFDFDIPVELWETSQTESTYRMYHYNKILGTWEFLEPENEPKIKNAATTEADTRAKAGTSTARTLVESDDEELEQIYQRLNSES